jgi:predicted nucleotide-binding protein (sugar kinase/HSP70/actin superfamily)
MTINELLDEMGNCNGVIRLILENNKYNISPEVELGIKEQLNKLNVIQKGIDYIAFQIENPGVSI